MWHGQPPKFDPQKNYYKILGVSESANPGEIKALVGDLGCTGVWNGVAAISTSTVGPCGAGYGNSEF